MKWLATDYWLIQLLFIRSIVIVISAGLFISIRHGRDGFKTSQPGEHLLRTVFNFFAFVNITLQLLYGNGTLLLFVWQDIEFMQNSVPRASEK
ncbi:hypothetical protein IH785_17065 [candidate division KSB1 bacterium]|nr:hypothetical protein [candidate division KSB1 bacterium]